MMPDTPSLTSGGFTPPRFGVPGLQDVLKREKRPLSCPVAAELLRLLSLQKEELNGPRCVAFPAALTRQSHKRGRRGKPPLERGQQPRFTGALPPPRFTGGWEHQPSKAHVGFAFTISRALHSLSRLC